MEPLDMLRGDLIGKIMSYSREASRQIKAIFANPPAADHWEHVSTIIIPTRVPGGWTFYCTSRYPHSQCLVRFLDQVREGNEEADTELIKFDFVMYGVGKGYMVKFLNYLTLHNTGGGPHQEFVRQNAMVDGNNQKYNLLQKQEYCIRLMSSGEVTMFMLHELLTTGRDNVSELIKVPEALYKKTRGGTPGHQYCRWAMQLTFAAGQCIGRLTEDEETKERNPNSALSRERL